MFGGERPAHHMANTWRSGYLHPQPGRFHSIHKGQGAAGRQGGSTKRTARQRSLIVLNSDAVHVSLGCTDACQIREVPPKSHASDECADLQLTCVVLSSAFARAGVPHRAAVVHTLQGCARGTNGCTIITGCSAAACMVRRPICSLGGGEWQRRVDRAAKRG